MIDFHIDLFPDNMFDFLWKSFHKLYGITILYKYHDKQFIQE